MLSNFNGFVEILDGSDSVGFLETLRHIDTDDSTRILGFYMHV